LLHLTFIYKSQNFRWMFWFAARALNSIFQQWRISAEQTHEWKGAAMG
jgi:hypothetical protein